MADLTIFFKNVDFLPKIHNVPSLGLKERWMNHRILMNNAEQISYFFFGNILLNRLAYTLI